MEEGGIESDGSPRTIRPSEIESYFPGGGLSLMPKRFNNDPNLPTYPSKPDITKEMKTLIETGLTAIRGAI